MWKKSVAIALSLFTLAYVGLALAEGEENGTQNETEKTQEQNKKQWEQNREQRKIEWEQKREEWKTEREQAIENLKQKKEEFQTMRDKFTEERCARIEEKIKNRTEWFSGSKEKHASVYTNLLNRIDKFIARFEAFNANPANTTKIDSEKIQKLKDDRAHLADLITNFKSSFADYFTKLKGAENFTCGHSEGEFRSSLLDARTYLKTVHENAAAIRIYVRETILPDFLAIKKEVAQIKGENGQEDTDGEDSGASNQ